MLTWLTPLWLLGLAALAVPVVIHLRRRRIGRRIRVGSLRHIAGTATPRARRLQLRDPWRFLVRCAIVAAVALGLAGPLLRRASPRAEHWVLISPDVLADSGLLARDPLFDSLRRAGTPIRSLSPGFQPTTLRPAPGPARQPSANTWSLLRDVDRRMPPGSSMLAVLRPRAEGFRGERPALAASAEMRFVGGAQRDTTWLEAGWAGGESTTVILGAATGGGVRFRSIPAVVSNRPPIPELPELSIRRSGDSIWAALPGDSIRLLQPEPTTFIVTAAPDRSADRRYLVAALAAVSGTYGLKAAIDTDAATAGRITIAPGGWLAWLDSARPPTGGAGSTTLRETEAPPPAPGDASVAEAPLTDAFGRPLVTDATEGSGRVLTLRGRLNPRWSDLVLQGAFPELLARVWAAPLIGLDRPPRLDPRSIAPRQAAPTRAVTHRDGTAESVPLRQLLLLAAAMLFLAERWTAHRPRK